MLSEKSKIEPQISGINFTPSSSESVAYYPCSSWRRQILYCSQYQKHPSRYVFLPAVLCRFMTLWSCVKSYDFWCPRWAVYNHSCLLSFLSTCPSSALLCPWSHPSISSVAFLPSAFLHSIRSLLTFPTCCLLLAWCSQSTVVPVSWLIRAVGRSVRRFYLMYFRCIVWSVWCGAVIYMAASRGRIVMFMPPPWQKIPDILAAGTWQYYFLCSHSLS